MDTNAQAPAAPAQTSAQPAATTFPDLSSTPATPDAAKAALETLRQERLSGRVDQQRYVDRAEFLQKVIAGEQVTAPNPYPTMEERLQQQYDESMQAPVELHGYMNLPTMSTDGAQAQEIDTAMRTAFRAGGIPAQYAPTIAERVLAMSRESPDDVAIKVSTTGNQLRSRWGGQFATRKAAIDAIVEKMAAADERIAASIEAEPGIIYGDVFLMDLLDRVAQHQRRRGA